MTADAYGGAAATINYIEDFFQIWLRTGTGASATVTTGLNGSTKETLVWTKSRSATTDHKLTDNVRGATKALSSNTTGAEATDSQGLTAFSSTGFTLGTSTDYNNSGATYVYWQWVSQPKFFDTVTYTGTGTNSTIAHNLGSVPGCIFVKRTDTTANWAVYHRSLANTQYLVLNSTAAATTGATWWNSTTATSTVFSVGTDASVNASGGTYVAYLFAHDAGGFGLTGTDNVISCGSFTSNARVSLGWEPQFLLFKEVTSNHGSDSGWLLQDTMRGLKTSNSTGTLYPNTLNAEGALGDFGTSIDATGFTPAQYADTYIYIAIRRGPMKVPTLGTSVYNANIYTGNATANTTVAGNFGFPVDLMLLSSRNANATDWSSYAQFVSDRLRGRDVSLGTSKTDAEVPGWTNYQSFSIENSIGWGLYGNSSGGPYINNSGGTFVARGFQRAPGFFDVVCYTGNDVTNRQITHNLGVAPELLIVKARQLAATRWAVLYATGTPGFAYLDADFPGTSPPNASFFGNGSSYVAPTASVFTVGTATQVNTATSGGGYVAYLFATCPGVSKVGSYTGNGTTQTINCGFTGGARFVFIKRTDATGDWYVYDTGRGMTVLTDPYLLLNSSAAEVATLGSVTTVATGFALNSTILAAINVSAGTYIFLAIA